jgi:hypothetical protein
MIGGDARHLTQPSIELGDSGGAGMDLDQATVAYRDAENASAAMYDVFWLFGNSARAA